MTRSSMAAAGRIAMIAIATVWLWPADAAAERAPRKGTHRAKITVHPKRSPYGFLPGYRQPPNLTDWRAQNRISANRTEPRYFDYWGNVRYGWGPPGFYRGRWNGGGFGPCWAATPIGMMPTCGP
jgi:hypothetical protein